VLLPEELNWLLAQPHKPLAAGQALSTIVQAVETDSTVRTRFDRLISIYTYEFGACNRIYNTAIPQAYTM
jgi:predicted membrane chloride channel (bestrophin family)